MQTEPGTTTVGFADASTSLELHPIISPVSLTDKSIEICQLLTNHVSHQNDEGIQGYEAQATAPGQYDVFPRGMYRQRTISRRATAKNHSRPTCQR